jgi:ABC-type transporter Mla subunit MlaD
LFAFVDPVTTIVDYKQGGLILVAITMFVGNFCQNWGIKNSSEKLAESVSDLVKNLAETHQHTSEALASMHHSVADTLQRVLENQHEVAESLAAQAASLLSLTHSLNEVVRELLGIIREAKG